MKVLILAAGYGTRLYPHTKNYPKPLLLVNKRPVIDYLLDKLEVRGAISEIIIVTNNRFFKHFQAWRKCLKFKSKIRIVNDLSESPEDKLGAIRDMDFVFRKEKKKEDFLVLGGDNYFSQPLAGFLSFARRKRPCITIGTFDIRIKAQARHYGVVSLNSVDRIIDFTEKPRNPKTTRVAMCLYYFPATKVGLVKEYLSEPGNHQDAVGAYIKWLVNKDRVYGFTFKKLWFDIGHIAAYEKLNKLLKEKEE
jgi:glucose-1-phosphate thymidylyltransferase